MNFKTIEWKDDKVILIDQRKLPVEEVYVECSDYKQVADAIQNMTVRGAPAIGVTAAMGAALGALGIGTKSVAEFSQKMETIFETLYKTRPTAVNLGWGINRMMRVVQQNQNLSVSELKERLKGEALTIWEENM